MRYVAFSALGVGFIYQAPLLVAVGTGVFLMELLVESEDV